jgi:uncharacterized repeat protein (TIGR01451 family)
MKILKRLFAYLLLNVMLFSQASAQSITTTVCIEPKFGGLNAVFGYESRNPNVTAVNAGPSNSLSSVPAEPLERQLTAFYPGYWQQGFAIFFIPTADNPILSWTLLGQTVSASWNTRLCDVSRQILPSLDLADGVSFVTPGSSVIYTLTIQNSGVGAEQDGLATVTNRFPMQCSSVSWTCRSDTGGSTCTAAGTGDIDDLIILAPAGRVTYLATCATAATASGSMINVAAIGSNEITDTNRFVSAIFSINSVSAMEGNSAAAPMAFTVTRTGGVGTQTVSVASGSGGSATAGVDYTPLAGTVLSFAPGVSTRTVSVAILGDTIDEPDETFNLILTSPSSGTGINSTIGIGGIIDDDPTATRLAFSAPPARARINQAIPYTIALDVDRPGAGVPAGTIHITNGNGSASCTIAVPTSTPTTAPSCAPQFAALGPQTLSASFAPSDANFSASATTASANTLVFAQADLAVTIDDGITSYQAGELLIYTVILRNTGPDAAPRVRLQNVVPSELQNPRWSCAASGGAVCPAATGVGSIDAIALIMPANGALIYTLSASVAAPAPATISNRAEVFLPADNTVEDGVLSNQSQTDVNVRELVFASGFEGF